MLANHSPSEPILASHCISRAVRLRPRQLWSAHAEFLFIHRDVVPTRCFRQFIRFDQSDNYEA
jgi:microsomal dipeptidase-like Zn-dependent dipeptidase